MQMYWNFQPTRPTCPRMVQHSFHHFIFSFPCHLSVCLFFQHQQKNTRRVHVCALSVALVQMLSGPASPQPLRLLNESACYIIRDGWMQILWSLRRKFLATCQFWLQSFRGDYIVQLYKSMYPFFFCQREREEEKKEWDEVGINVGRIRGKVHSVSAKGRARIGASHNQMELTTCILAINIRKEKKENIRQSGKFEGCLNI